MKLYLLDETNTHFEPQTCEEAVLLFTRIRRISGKGGQWSTQVVSTLRRCARSLPEQEYQKFHDWVINPYSLETTPETTENYFAMLNEGVVLEPETDCDRTGVDLDDEKQDTNEIAYIS